MTSRAMNVAPNEPVVNRDIRPRCLILAAPFGRPRPPSGAGKPQESLGTSHLGAHPSKEGMGETPALGFGVDKPKKGQGGTWEGEGLLQFGVAPSRCAEIPPVNSKVLEHIHAFP